MKSFLHLSIFCLIFLTAFSACKKYDEGGLHANAHKNLKGNFDNYQAKAWRVGLYEVNGIDSTGSFRTTKYDQGFRDYDVKIYGKFNNKKNFEFETPSFHFDAELSKDKTTLNFTGTTETEGKATFYESDNTYERNIFLPEPGADRKISWRIQKLKDDNLIITTTIGQNNYKIILDFYDEYE